MDDVTTCPRCRGGIFVTGPAQWSVVADAERLRQQGWVGFSSADGVRSAVHLGCLSWAEKEALLGSARAEVPRVHPERSPRASPRFVRRAAQAPATTQVAEGAHAA